MPGPVARWLETFMCKQYADTFEAYGFKTLQSVSCQMLRLQNGFLHDFPFRICWHHANSSGAFSPRFWVKKLQNFILGFSGMSVAASTTAGYGCCPGALWKNTWKCACVETNTFGWVDSDLFANFECEIFYSYFHNQEKKVQWVPPLYGRDKSHCYCTELFSVLPNKANL